MSDEKHVICPFEDCHASGAYITVHIESEDVTGSGIQHTALCGLCNRTFDITEDEYGAHQDQIEHALAHAGSVPHVH